MRSRFWHYNTRFDAVEAVARHAADTPPGTTRPDRVVNFLGVAIDPVIFPPALDAMVGRLEAAPMPNNWHADLAEWGSALRAVDRSGPHFTMIELGCGWGCWMNNTGVAAKRSGRSVHVIGVEGDAGHIDFARKTLSENGFADTEWTLVTGIAAGHSGVALFPVQDQPGESWGLQPIFGADDIQTREALESGRFTALPMIGLEEIAAPHERIDLLHIDIQGSEADLVQACMPAMAAKVANVLIGTHSRQIEGRLFDIMLGAGWVLDMERPAFLSLAGERPEVTVDGVQSWRNPALLPG